MNYLSLPFFPFVRGEVLPATSSTPHLIVFSTLLELSPVFFFQSSSSPAFFNSLLRQSSHLILGLHRLLLPSSRNYAALFGSLSSRSAMISTCPAHCSLLLTSLSVKLLRIPVSSINSTKYSSPACPRYTCYFSHPVVFAHLQRLLTLYFGHCQGFRSCQLINSVQYTQRIFTVTNLAFCYAESEIFSRLY